MSRTPGRFGSIAAIIVGVLLVPVTEVDAETAVVLVDADNAELAGQVRSVVEDKVRALGIDVRPFTEIVLNEGLNPAEVFECVDADIECMKAAASSADVGRLLIVDVKGAGADEGEPHVVVTAWLFDGRTGERLHGDRRFCEECSAMSQLWTASGELATALFEKELERLRSLTKATFSISPSEARVTMDGVPVEAGQPIPVEPGTHVLVVEHPGYSRIEKSFDAEPGENTELAVQLDPVGDDREGQPRPSLWTLGALAGGVAGLALGVTWIAIDGPQIDGNMRQPERRETLVPGIATTVVGAGLVATSVFLYLRDRRSDRQSVGVVPTAGGAMVGVFGRF